MKILIIIAIMLTLQGCVFNASKQHEAIMVETLQSVCGVGSVEVESTNKNTNNEVSSYFGFKCTISGSTDKIFELN